jgi:subtilisin family serine protease
VVLSFAAMLAATLLLAGVALTQPAVDDTADRYIVVLEDDVENPSQVASGMEQRRDLEVGFVYSSAVEGFSAEIPDEALAAVRADPQVDYVERDTTVHAVGQTVPWGIDKIGADESSTLTGDGSGAVSDVNAYVIDTGIYRGPTSPRKGYRDLNVVNHIDFTGGKNTDCDEGHGTHVAGVVAAKDNARAVVGVAPGAPLTGVKVLGCEDDGLASTVIEGIDWVTKDVKGPDGIADTADDKKPAIANLSLTGEPNQTLDDAVRRSAASGVFYSVAAGNKGRRACDYSPARAGRTWTDSGWVYDNGIVTTAAVRIDREEAGWSNYGSCVDLWAPGVDILSTKNKGGLSTMSGTSMAAPHVGGTAALYLSNPNSAGAAPATVEDLLKVDAARVQSEEKRSKDGSRIKVVYAGDY